MGNCCSSSEELIKKFAIKFPGTTSYIDYDNDLKKFEANADINVWLGNLYCLSHWTNWIVYNDQAINGVSKKSLCKGILTWNNQSIGWLCHTVPLFPRVFTGSTISLMENSHNIYSQSFQYIEVPYSDILLNNILNQINIMDANIYIKKYELEYKNLLDKNHEISIIEISKSIIHIAKPPSLNIDIYEYIVDKYNNSWTVATSQKYNYINNKNNKIITINEIEFQDFKYSNKYNLSKEDGWAFSEGSHYWIGGFICEDNDLNNALNKLFKS
jgi:hypothetical protein